MAYRRAPYEFEAKAGVQYDFCTCGVSTTGPLCDDSHQQQGKKPVSMQCVRDETLLICACGRTKASPVCDGSHRIFD